MSYKTILFDWDGCLADTLGHWLTATRNQFNKYGFFPSDIDIVSQYFGNWDAFKSKIPDGFKDIAVRELVDMVNLNLKTVALHKDVKETLMKLKDIDKSLAVISWVLPS